MKCNFCNLESELDAKYCRKCGKLVNLSSKPSTDELDDEQNMPDESVSPHSTSVIGVDFSHQSSPKMVEPLQKADGSSTATVRHRRRKLQTMLFRAVVLLVVLQLAVTVAILIWLSRHEPMLQPQPAQVQTPAGVGASQTSSATIPAAETPSTESTEAVTALPNENDLDKEIVDKRRTSEELDKEIAGKTRRLKKLNKEVSVAQNTIKELKAQIVVAEARVAQLKGEIASAELALRRRQPKSRLAKGKPRDYTTALAQLQRKKREVARLQREVKGLREKADQERFKVSDLQREMASMRNVNGGSRNRRSLRKV